MKTIKLSQDIEHEGLVAGDVLSVDDNSAAALIRSGRAEAYDPQAPADDTANVVPEPKVTAYGDQEGVRTIDDIRDPEAARNRRVMSFATVAEADHGPVATEPAEADTSKASRPKPGRPGTTTTTPSVQAAPDAKSAGGDAGGGNS
jgi:DNA helicase TIP49 (TBP-interacting protein)